MVERRPIADFFTHALLILGIAIVMLPVWIAFVASSLSPERILDAPMTLLPGDRLVANYAHVLFEGPTVGELAERVEERLRAGQPTETIALVRLERDGPLPLSFALTQPCR